MELDPRLQNISAADLQDFTVPHYPNFDQGYQSALYESGLTDDHGPPSHPQTYPQFVTDPNETSQFGPSGAGATQRRGNNGSVGRSQNVGIRSSNVNAQSLHTASPVSARQRRHIPQHPTQPHFNNNPFSPSSSTISHVGRLQHSAISHSPTTSPLTRASPAGPLSQQSPIQHHQPQAQPSLQSLSHPQPQQQQQDQQPLSTPSRPSPQEPVPDPSQFTHPSTFPLVPNPPNLAEWREKFFNIVEPLLLTGEEYHTYFPHVDNIYSHRSTQKYKKKPFVSHYWDCRLKGRPTGTPLSKLRRRQEGKADEDDEPEPASGGGDGQDGNSEKDVKKRKRKTRERDLCDVKIKVTEFFGRDELESLGKLAINDQGGDDGTMDVNGNGMNSRMSSNGQLTFVLEDGSSNNPPPPTSASRMSINQTDDTMPFGVLEPMKKLPEGHPGAEGKRWYMVQRVNGSGKDDDDASLDHKHTLEESDRIKKNSVQRWLLTQEKERKKQTRNKGNTDTDGRSSSRAQSIKSAPSFHASGKAQQTAKSHASPTSTQLAFYANSFCPFAQRIWIALEMKGIPYQYVEVTPSQMKDGKCTIPGLLEVCPEGIIPLLQHGNWAIWESDVVLEYLEDLSIGHSLLPLGDPQLRAHSRLWKDHINRKVLPYFYALLLLPATEPPQADGQPAKPSLAERQSSFIVTLQAQITELVNASHATGPFFLGPEMSFVDVAFAPWIIRLSRVLEHYREFPKPEVGTRWKAWVDAIESNEGVRRTVSEEKSYHAVYGGVGKDSYTKGDLCSTSKGISEMKYASMLVRQEGFGLGGDVWGTLLPSEAPGGRRT